MGTRMIQQLFERFGKLRNVFSPLNKETKQVRGFTFVKFFNCEPETILKILQQLNNSIHKLDHAEGPLATSASGLSTLSIKKINYSKVYS